jgi:hypothetical protein
MFCQSNDFFYSCHRIFKLSYLFNIGLWLHLLRQPIFDKIGLVAFHLQYYKGKLFLLMRVYDLY